MPVVPKLLTTVSIVILCLKSFVFSASGQTFSGDTGMISDDGLVNYFNLQVSGVNPSVLDTAFGIISVCIDVSHTWDDDLVIWLKSPDNTMVELTSHNGWDWDNYDSTCFDMDASTGIMNGTPPFTGSFIPEGNLGDINNGQDPNGTWQLVIVDEYAYADYGDLHWWNITFGNHAPGTSALLTSSNLPLIIINTNGQLISDVVRIQADMGIIDNGPGNSNHPGDLQNNFSGMVSIEKRGSSSIGFPQSSYSFETEDSAGENLNVSLLDMPKENDWVLYAPYNDKSLMRNALIYRLSNELGRYASRTRFCEVILNNSYQGIYVLMEKIKVDSARVNIADLNPQDIVGDELTGGYILKIDKFDGEQVDYFTSQYPPCNDTSVWQEIYYQYHAPQPEDIVWQQKNYIHSYVDSFEYALLTADFADPISGYRKYADESSFIDFALLNEISKNVDGYRWSTFLFKDKNSNDGKLNMGPIWDFNLAFGNADYYNGAYTDGWEWDFPCPFPYDGGLNPFWWQRLLQDSVYYQHLQCRWKDLRNNVFDLNHINSLIDSFAMLLDSAEERHFEKYPILGVYVWPNAYYPPTYTEEIDTLKNWIAARVQWMDDQLGSGCLATGVNMSGGEYTFQVFPNPAAFNSIIQIEIATGESEKVSIDLHDLSGKRLANLFEGNLHRGSHTIQWNASQLLSAGCYVVVMKTKEQVLSKKILLFKD